VARLLLNDRSHRGKNRTHHELCSEVTLIISALVAATDVAGSERELHDSLAVHC
jgi:hypothetical protein